MSLPPSTIDIPLEALVFWAKTCDEIKTKGPNGPSSGTRAKSCCFCGQVVLLGLGNNDHSLLEHMRSKKCRTFQHARSSGSFAASIPGTLTEASGTVNSKIAYLSDDTDKKYLPQERNTNDSAAQHLPLNLNARSIVDLGMAPGLGAQKLSVLELRNGGGDLYDASSTCPGAFFDFGQSMFCHYPWHLHSEGRLSYEFSFIDPKGCYFYVQSPKCTQKSAGSGLACNVCSRVVIGKQFQDIVQRAAPGYTFPPTANTLYRTWSQLNDLLNQKAAQINQLKLQKLTSEQRVHSLDGSMSDHKRLMAAISESDDTYVGRIVQTALRHGVGVNTIIDRLVRAQQGLYNPQMYSKKLLDISALVLKIGGPRLAFAMAKAMHLPSISTVNSRLSLPQLRPSIGYPSIEDITANIHSFFGSEATKLNTRPQSGLSLMIDEMAIEPRLRYSARQDGIVGVCREHAHLAELTDMSKRSAPLDTLLATKALLDSGECHRATEATMAAIARFGELNYNPAVILASSTCKREKAPEQAQLIGLILESWRQAPDGECIHGPIWSACTDGDPGRRIAMFKNCMNTRLAPTSRLYRLLGNLPLLNLFCGPTEITHDGDYKHEEKRLASALRSSSGFLVNGAHITPKMLVKYLRCLNELSEQRILSFFDGSDPQNVPKANALLTNLYRASLLPSIASLPENKPFILLCEVLGSFVLPYTSPTMCLTEQVTSLAKCGLLLFTLYRSDGAKFLPGQLVYDMQTSIKNVMFCIGKTQLIDSSLPFYLLQTGTNRLESRFGTYRTTTSDRNGDVLQMSERAAGAQHIDEIFCAHPKWNRVPYRLSLDGCSGIDHTNPTSWSGDVTVGSVELDTAWAEGFSQARNILTRTGVVFQADPAVLLLESPNINLMRPYGKYPGIQVDIIEPIMLPATLKELLDCNVDANVAEPDGNRSCESNQTTQPQALGDEELSIEHLLPPTLGDPAPENSEKGWIMVDNKRVHLESAVRYLLGADGTAKSTDRLRRVCGFSRYGSSSSSRSEPLLGDYFHVADLAATFLCADGQVSLAIIRITSILDKSGASVESLSEAQFNTPGTVLSGQVLQLEHDAGIWYWNQQYNSKIFNVSKSTQSRKRQPVLEVNAYISRPVSPELVERNGTHVWAFDSTQMNELMNNLWTVCSARSLGDNIPSCQASILFPYRAEDNSIVLSHQQSTNAIQRAVPPAEAACFLCKEIIKIKRGMRVHIGRHLLSLQAHPNNASPHMLPYESPCGFCGRPKTCTTTLQQQSKSVKSTQIVSNCPYRDYFVHSTSHKLTNANPCTNRPVRCARCPLDNNVVWSYNFKRHVLIFHNPQTLAEMTEYIGEVSPSSDEYDCMGIDQKTGALRPAKTGKRKREAEQPDCA